MQPTLPKQYLVGLILLAETRFANLSAVPLSALQLHFFIMRDPILLFVVQSKSLFIAVPAEAGVAVLAEAGAAQWRPRCCDELAEDRDFDTLRGASHSPPPTDWIVGVECA